MHQIALDVLPFATASKGKRTRPTVALPTALRYRRFSYGNSVLEKDGAIWRMQIRENGYYAGGFAIGRLLDLADYPGVKFCRSAATTKIFALLHRLIGKKFSDIRIPERYLDELHGYADATGIAYKTLFTVNFVFDVLKRYGMHCSSVVVSEPGATMIGRNTDLLPWLGRLALKWFPSIVMDVATPGKLRYVHVTPALFLGAFNGYNERGLAVMSHQIGATKEKPVQGNLATTLLQRMLLEEAGDLAEAESITRANPVQRCISNLIVSTKERESCVFEISPTLVKIFPGTGSYQCCVTHFEDAELSPLHRKAPEASRSRLKLMNSIAAKARARVNDLIALLKNCDNGISHKDSGRSPTNAGTYQSLVFDILKRRIFVADGPSLPVSLSGTYREIAVGI
ncbi:MAG TPA: C45 family peptidase [Micropepsaceae bacterium]|nr:C45 family peptidase [Micropepsaceae bacterium]